MTGFSSILKALGLGKPEVAKKENASTAPTKKPTSVKSPSYTRDSGDKENLDRFRPGSKVQEVDVVGMLEGLAAANAEQLDWKVSIVDLLKLLGIDSGLDDRKELALELKIPAELMDDSAEMNTWLHKTVLQKIAKNGGNIPRELLD